MKSAINKKNLIKTMSEETGEQGIRATAGILLALVEIRETIEDGFHKLEGAQSQSFDVLFGCKETLDAFLQRRLGSEEVLAKMTDELDDVVKTLGARFDSEKGPEDDEPPDEQKKSGVSQEEENFGPIPYGSGKT